MKLVLGRNDLAAAALSAAEGLGVEVERLDVRPVHNASHGFVNDQAVDICEIAIVTLLQAACYGKPVVLLPITSLGRYQHQTLVTCGELSVDEIEGRSVGVRSWSQTTGVWVRGFLSEQYGVDLHKVDWLVYEGSHVAEYSDPSWVRPAADGAVLQQDFLAGRLDYGIMGNELPVDDRIRPAIANVAEVSRAWAEDKGFAPVNHVLAVSAAAASEHPQVICAMYDAMGQVLAAEPATAPVPLCPVGFDGLQGPLSLAAQFAAEQEVLPRKVSFEELVEQSCEALGVPRARLGG
jgi:4,5-dihydroxyphthalate decarboxylase